VQQIGIVGTGLDGRGTRVGAAGPGPDGRAGATRQLAALQALRAIAALAVILFHARLELAWRHIAVPLPELTVGAAGVDLFFVVSGFVMVHASRALFGSTGSVKPFLLRRLVRIVPLYWFFTLARLLYIVAANRHSSLLDDWPSHLFYSLSFVPPGDGRFPIVVQGWTLSYEMAFYLAFALCLPLREGRALLILSGALALIGTLGGLGLVQGRAGAIANPQLFEFLGGMLVARLHGAGLRLAPVPAAGLALAGAAALLATAPALEAIGPWRGLVWGVPATAIVAAATLGRGSGRRAVPALLLRLGDASYSLYLCHMLVFTLVSRVLLGLAVAHPVGALAYFAVSIAAAVLAGLASHRWIERPMFAFCTARLRGAGAAAGSAARRDRDNVAGPPDGASLSAPDGGRAWRRPKAVPSGPN
jgi:peptidoglycan/LPS O-acetylase OafA/YrhL